MGKITNSLLVLLSIPLAVFGIRAIAKRRREASSRSALLLRLILILRALLTVYTMVYVVVLIAGHVEVSELKLGLQYVVEFLGSLKVDWSPLP